MFKAKLIKSVIRLILVTMLVACIFISLSEKSQVVAASWLGTWQNRIEITIDYTNIDDTLTNFPILLHISSSSGIVSDDVSVVFDELTSDANRKKIAVTTSDGTTQCYVEIVRWDDDNELAYLYVKVPSISSTADTYLYLYYDAAQSDNTTYVGDIGSIAAQNVWDANFVGVYHMTEQGNGTAGEYKDSTANGHNGQGGTADGKDEPTLTTDSLFGYAQTFDGTNDFLFIPDNADFSIVTTLALTVEAWFCPATLEFNEWDYIYPLGKHGYSGSPVPAEWVFAWYNDTPDPSTERSQWISFYVKESGETYGAGCNQQSAGLSINTWYYLTGWAYGTSATSGTERIERDCIFNGAYASWESYGLTVEDTTARVNIGNYTGVESGYYWNGMIGEVRFSNIVRPTEWRKATMFTEKDTLVTYGSSEVAAPAGAPTIILLPTSTNRIVSLIPIFFVGLGIVLMIRIAVKGQYGVMGFIIIAVLIYILIALLGKMNINIKDLMG